MAASLDGSQGGRLSAPAAEESQALDTFALATLPGSGLRRHLHPVRIPAGWYARRGKTALDRAGGIVLAAVTFPIVATGLLVARVALGPGVLIRQPRVGLGGDVFAMYKIRTMTPDRRLRALPYDGPDRRLLHKRADDPRHTTVGRFMRKWSIDELPQLWNVARGEMSLVGPRPELVSVVDRYGLWDHPRHLVRPGVTGLWQISDLRSRPLHEGVHVDLEYVRQVSLRRDLQILASTARSLRSGSGS